MAHCPLAAATFSSAAAAACPTSAAVAVLRVNAARTERLTRTAADLVNHTSERALADLIFQLGEERRARRIARAIVRARPLRSTLHLADVVERAVHRTGRLHPATQTFMALRMAVNDEPGELDRLLRFGPEILNGGGRMVVLSFMSIDDRKVKERFRELAKEGKGVILTKRPLQPEDDEVKANPASRSAKLRALERVDAA